MSTEQDTAPAVDTATDADLLKQKKEAAKKAKEAEKAEKKAAKEERVHSAHHGKERTVAAQKRNPLKVHGKKYRKAAELIEKTKYYSLADAVALMQKTSVTKFDSSLEIHVRLGIDTKKGEQAVRSTVPLPNGTGKTLRVAAFVEESQVAAAKKAGAVVAGEDDLIDAVAKGAMDFDVAIATPAIMKKLGKIAKTLGQKGLMPNPKAGTVTDDVEKTIAEIQKGKVEFRNDKNGILHNTVGKVSFDTAKLVENIQVYLRAVQDTKPKAVKGGFILAISLATSQGPGVKVDSAETIREL